MILEIVLLVLLGIGGIIFLSGINVIRPTERGVKETLGKYSGFVESGFNWIFPFTTTIHRINITERMAQISRQEIITEDKLNASVDLVVFYKVKTGENDIKNAFYNVNNFADQIVTLAQTTARNVIGEMNFSDVNSKRNTLNKKLAEILRTETKSWGVDIVRVELKEIVPPEDVQETMNQVIKAENDKKSAIDFATAKETEADGIKRASIKQAEGDKQSSILRAEGVSKAFQLVHKSFKGNAQKLKQLETLESSLRNNSKIVLGNGAKDLLKLLNLDK